MNQHISPLFVSNSDPELTSEGHQQQQEQNPDHQRNEEDEWRRDEWHPTRQSFLLAIIAISPFVSMITYKMGFISAIYLSILLFLTGPLAIQVQDRRTAIRWICGLVSVVFMSAIKTATFLTKMSDDKLVIKVFFYNFTALWECSNALLVFGGRPVLERYGITSYSRALLACFCPSQIRFVNVNTLGNHGEYVNTAMTKYRKHTAHIGAYIAAFFIFRQLFRMFADTIESVPILEAEAIVILLSCIVHVWNLPPHLWQLFMILCKDPVQIVYPYGSIYFSTSSRQFWRKWSRPASAIVRHMFYHPLGGSSKYPYLSIPLMFFLNASSHYDVSNALVGDRSEMGWNLVFGTLGVVATLEVVGDSFMNANANAGSDRFSNYHAADISDNNTAQDYDETGSGHTHTGTSTDHVNQSGTSETSNCWGAEVYRAVRFIVALASLRFAAYTLLHRCLHLSLSSMLS